MTKHHIIYTQPPFKNTSLDDNRKPPANLLPILYVRVIISRVKKKVQFFRRGKIISTKFHWNSSIENAKKNLFTILSITSTPDGNNGFVSAPCPISLRWPSRPPSTSIFVQKDRKQASPTSPFPACRIYMYIHACAFAVNSTRPIKSNEG